MKSDEITKFIRGNYQSNVVKGLFSANEKGDRVEFNRLLKKIKICVYVKQQIIEDSKEIELVRQRIKTRKHKLDIMMNDGRDMLAEIGIEV